MHQPVGRARSAAHLEAPTGRPRARRSASYADCPVGSSARMPGLRQASSPATVQAMAETSRMSTGLAKPRATAPAAAPMGEAVCSSARCVPNTRPCDCGWVRRWRAVVSMAEYGPHTAPEMTKKTVAVTRVSARTNGMGTRPQSAAPPALTSPGRRRASQGASGSDASDARSPPRRYGLPLDDLDELVAARPVGERGSPARLVDGAGQRFCRLQGGGELGHREVAGGVRRDPRLGLDGVSDQVGGQRGAEIDVLALPTPLHATVDRDVVGHPRLDVAPRTTRRTDSPP